MMMKQTTELNRAHFRKKKKKKKRGGTFDRPTLFFLVVVLEQTVTTLFPERERERETLCALFILGHGDHRIRSREHSHLEAC